MARKTLDQLPDSQIPVVRAPNPILDQVVESRIARAKALHLPGLPLSVAKRAQEAATSTGVLLILLVGLVVKLTGKPVVKIKSTLLRQSGLSEDQLKRAVCALSKVEMVSVNSGPGRRREITLIDEEYLAWLKVPRQTPP